MSFIKFLISNMQNNQPMNEDSSQLTQIYEIITEGIEQIERLPIINVNSYSISKDNDYLIICTKEGIVLVDNKQFKFKLYLRQDSPFWLVKLGNSSMLSTKLGSLVSGRTQIAVVPFFTSNNFNQTHVYIFDYQMKCLLYNVDFFLPIQSLHITESQIYVSNKKRFIIYNYLDDNQSKDQQYYLEKYVDGKDNDRLRYVETFCTDYQDPYTINQINQTRRTDCKCGKFLITQTRPYVLVFVKTFTLNNKRNKIISIYNEKYDKEQNFMCIPDESIFQIILSADGEYLAYTTGNGCNIIVYKLNQMGIKNQPYCVLYAGRTPRQIIHMQFFSCKIKGTPSFCLGMLRNTLNSTGTLHIFKLQKKPVSSPIESQFKRYLSLFQSLFKDYSVADKLIGPGFFVKNNVLYVYSLCGIVNEVINFTKPFNQEKLKIQNIFCKWKQDSLPNQ